MDHVAEHARHGADPRLRGRDLLHDVQPAAGRRASSSRSARTTPCWLRGSDDVVQACEQQARHRPQARRTADGKFSLIEVECLGACVNAPIVQINDDFYEDLDAGDARGAARRAARAARRRSRARRSAARARRPIGGPPRCCRREARGTRLMLRDKDRIFTNLYGVAGLAPRRRARSAAPGTTPRR